MAFYKTCPRCGANLDPGEHCNCEQEEKRIAIWNDTDQIKHNHTVQCPYCHKYLMCKSEGMGRQKLFAVQWSVLVQKHDDEVLVRYFCHTKDFRTDFRNPKIKSSERYRTVHTAEKARDFEWGRFKSTQEIRWCVYKDKSYGYFTPPETVVPRSAVLYNDNLSEMVAGTCMKYSAIDIYLDKVVNNSQRTGGADWEPQSGTGSADGGTFSGDTKAGGTRAGQPGYFETAYAQGIGAEADGAGGRCGD